MLRTAVIVVLIPCAVALASQVAILAIPGCNPNPYALGRCLIGSANLAAPLMLGVLGGLYVAAALGVFVSMPLFFIAQWRRRAEKQHSKEASNRKATANP